MNETRVTVVGTALTKPERKVLERSGAVVANFRVIANQRRLEKDTGNWVDGSHFRVKVNCWRRLADHVVASVNAGDPIIVTGRISTREWKSEAGEPRISYELDADAVGHDLSRGVDVFTRTRLSGPNSVVDDVESDNRVNGELTHAYPGQAEAYGTGYDGGAAGYDDSYPDGSDHDGSDHDGSYDGDALSILRQAGLDPNPDDPTIDEEEDSDEEELVGAAAGSGGAAGRSRRRGRAPGSA